MIHDDFTTASFDYDVFRHAFHVDEVARIVRPVARRTIP